MKKQLLILTLLSIVVFFVGNYAFAQDIGTIKIGLDMSGEHEVSGEGLSGSEDVEMGISLSGEYVSAINENIGIGAGITFQISAHKKIMREILISFLYMV